MVEPAGRRRPARQTAPPGPAPAPTPLWEPDEARRSRSRLRRYLDRTGFVTYDDAWKWSVAPDTAGAFWHPVAEEFDVTWRHEPTFDLIRSGAEVFGARWFGEGRLNYAERALSPVAAGPAGSGRGPAGPEAVAVIGRSQTRPDVELSRADLADLVSRVRRGLEAIGVRSGDRVAACLPNIPETLAAMLACASLGAVWTCCAPEMGVTGVRPAGPGRPRGPAGDRRVPIRPSND
jgi:acetoacetyl-CoA synthetase